MKALVMLILFFSISGVFAVSTDMAEEYLPGETIIVQIFGNILAPIQSSNIEWKRGNVQVPMDYDVKKLGENYYIYANLPKTENNYTLIIKDLETTVFGEIKKIDFEQNFSTIGEIAEYSITPALILAQKDFEVEVTLNRDLPLEISTDFPNERTIKLNPGKNKVFFSIKDVDSGFKEINLGDYKILAMVVKNDSVQTSKQEIIFFPKYIDSVVLSGKEKRYVVSMRNNDKDLENLRILYDEKYFIITPDRFNFFGNNETVEFEIIVFPSNSKIDKKISIITEGVVYEFPIRIYYTEDEKGIFDSVNSGEQYYCFEIGGKVCSSGNVCSSSIVETLDSPNCCTGACVAKSEESDYYWVGYLVGLVVLVIALVVFGKYYKNRKNK